MNYLIIENKENGWTLQITYNNGISYCYRVKKYIHALRLVQQLQFRLKEEDQILAA